MFQLDPLTKKKIKRFKSIKRGYYAFVGLMVAIVLALFAEVLVNNRAIVVRYQGHWYFPTYGAMISGNTFGLDYEYETNYRELKKVFAEKGGDDFLILPPVPFNPYENDLDVAPPAAPSVETQHYLGTDVSGRDMVARLFYGFRIGIAFSFVLMLAEYFVGISIGCLMGYYGGKFDLFFQRLIEIWSNMPTLYVVIIVASIIIPGFWMLAGILVAFSWTGKTWQMRTLTYREKATEYVMAARSVGMTDKRIIFSQILPNTVAIIVTFLPFSVAAGISALSSLDFLGFGLPPPTPSWGELLRQGTSRLESLWIVGSTVAALVLLLTTVTFIGEAVREAFDPKKHTTYE